MASCRELIMRAVGMFSDREQVFLDCELLMTKALGGTREQLLAYPEKEVSVEVEERFWSDVRELYLGKPVAYLLEKKEFYGLDFFVNENVLIPRPESELIVDLASEYLMQFDNLKVLDVGTGSGNILLALANTLKKGGKNVDSLGIDVSPLALEVAKKNSVSLECDSIVNFLESDLLSELDDRMRFNVITANLPYIGEVKHRYVSKETEQFEPSMALFGGYDGLGLYRKMFEQIKNKEIVFGKMFGEFGFAQAEDMENLLGEFFDDFEILPDLAGIPRVFVVRG